MAARAFLVSQVLEVDAGRRSVVLAPTRWMGLLLGPAFAATPAALLWVRTLGTYELTTTGWLIAAVWSLFALLTTAVFLGPNRRIAVDLERAVLTIGGPYGIGAAREAAVADIEIDCDESVMARPSGSSPRARLTATIEGKRRVLAYLANDGVPLARELARVLRAAGRAERPSLDGLETLTRALEGMRGRWSAASRPWPPSGWRWPSITGLARDRVEVEPRELPSAGRCRMPMPLSTLFFLCISSAEAQVGALRTIPELPHANARSADFADGVGLAEHALRRAPPRMRGTVDLPKMQRWLTTRFSPWLDARRRAMDEAERALRRVSSGPEATFAAAIVAVLHRELVRAVIEVAVPRQIASDPQLAAVYRDALEQAVAPVRARAREAFLFCAERSTGALGSWCGAEAGAISP